MDWQVIYDAIVRANKLGRNGFRVINAIYVSAPTATQNDFVVFQYDSGTQTASEPD